MMRRMTKLTACSTCGSFLPPYASACPSCARLAPRTRLPAAVRGLLAIGGGGLLSVTLSACYGAPCAGGGSSCYNDFCSDSSADTDGDGYCLEYDCDETRADVHEYAQDSAGDGVDQNCDGVDGVAGTDAGSSDAGSDAGTSSDGGASDGGAGDGGASSEGGASSDAAVSDAGA